MPSPQSNETLNLEQILKAFQLSVARNEIEAAIDYANCYEDAFYHQFFAAIATIYSKESMTFFGENKIFWKSHIDHEVKLCCVAALMQQGIVSHYDYCEQLGLNDESSRHFFKEAQQRRMHTLPIEQLLERAKILREKQKIAELVEHISQHGSIDLIESLIHTPSLPDEIREELKLCSKYILSCEELSDALQLVKQLDTKRDNRYKTKEIKYLLACKFVSTCKSHTDMLMEQLADIEYSFGYRAASAVANKNRSDILYLLDTLENGSLDVPYWNRAEEGIARSRIGISVASQYPDIAQDILKKSAYFDFYSLQLLSHIGTEPSYASIEKAFGLAQNLKEVDVPIDEVLVAIVTLTQDQAVLLKVLQWVDKIELAHEKYEVMAALRGKMEISFEDMHHIATRMSPLGGFYCKEASAVYAKKLLESTDKMRPYIQL